MCILNEGNFYIPILKFEIRWLPQFFYNKENFTRRETRIFAKFKE